MHVLSKVFAVAATLAVLMSGARASEQAAAPPSAGGPPPAQQAQGGPPPGDPLGPDLFIAIRTGTAADVKAVLAKGAKLEATNWLGFRPLMWAASLGKQEACAALLDAGANVNAPSHYGTALSFAVMSGNARLVEFLLGRGAKLTEDRADGITPLMSAADSGHVEVVRMLLARGKANVNAKDFDGATAIHFAARRGKTTAARLLIEAGADVNATDGHGRTALMYAAMNGYPACTALLLAHRASLNARDRAGNTALLLAARYAGEPQVIGALLRGGADPSLKDAKGRSAFDVALAHENRAAAAAIRPRGLLPAADSKELLPRRARRAVALSLPLLERGAKTFSRQAACTSCHHQGLGLMATGLAKERGIGYDRELAAAQIDLILKSDEAHAGEIRGVLPRPEMYKHVPGVDMGELTPVLAFVYSGLLAHGQRPGEIQSAMTTILASQQDDTGRWGFALHREPIQSSAFATTALTVRLLKAYMPAERAAETAQRIQKARTWLIATKAVTNEDRTFRLLGLKWAGADPKEIDKAAAELRGAQRPDGGWAQLPASGADPDGDAYTRSDAYATGQALYALHVGGGIATTAEPYRRGVRYLLRTQDEDGSWLVTKRAVPANNYFDAGFPHGESQYISYGATSWATMALILAAPVGGAQQQMAGAR